MRLILAIWAAKILIIVGKLIGKKGSATPGAIALKICPDILRILGTRVEQIVVVSGTNGKTSTNNMLYSILSQNGDVVCNNVGANMLSGVVCSFAKSAGLSGKMKAKYATLEIDEFSARHVFGHIKPHYLVITNLFPDQLDRYGSVENVLNALAEAAEMAPECKLILNGDDELLRNMNVPNAKRFFEPQEKNDYNNYNIEAARTVASSMEFCEEDIQRGLDNYKPPIGRMERFIIDGREFVLNLAKNPAGFNATIKMVLEDKRDKAIMVAINNNEGDGLDPSWISDVEFEGLSDIGAIVACGMCRDELADRLEIAGFEWVYKYDTLREGIIAAIDQNKLVTYILVNYTAIFDSQKILKKMSKKRNVCRQNIAKNNG